MATTIRRISTSVIERLRKEPWRFEFFEAARLLRLSHKLSQQAGGKAMSPLARFVTYRTHLSLNFPASEIQDLDGEDNNFAETPTKPPAMTVNFMGLTGPSGVLPRHYTEFLLARRVRYKDETAHRFFDLFNHRAISLFVEAWEKYRFYIGHEQGNAKNAKRYLLDLVGMGTTGLQDRLQQADQGIKDEMLAYYSGLNAQRPHSATALAAILQDYFKVNVGILQFQGRWLRLEPDQYTRIGKKGAYHTLGKSAVIGEFVWDHQSKFRVRIGPVNKNTFDAFLPIGNAFTGLKKYVDWYKALGQNYDVQLVLRKEEVPGCRLGEEGSARLGWSTWLRHQPFVQDAEDTVLSC
jgi:type VI secretion system protein ImpH